MSAAAAEMRSPRSRVIIAAPVRGVLRRQANATVRLAKVTGIDRAARRVETILIEAGFVIGDTALVLGETGKPVPGLAPAAKQQGAFVARLIPAGPGTRRRRRASATATSARSRPSAGLRRWRISAGFGSAASSPGCSGA
jgi:NADH dehydrogenase FAD-containing subunit